jgi:poly-D-alanine transfer protein DltD
MSKNYNITKYRIAYFAKELSKRFSSDNLEKLSHSIANAKVDLNPHQVEAALFAFKTCRFKNPTPKPRLNG